MRSLLLLLLWPLLAVGQVTVSTDTLTHVNPSAIMPAGKIYIDYATIPGIHIGSNDLRVSITCTGQYNGAGADGAGTCGTDHAGIDGPGTDGAFRISCPTSHYGFDDPIVWPGQPGKTHLHVFFGNNTTSSNTDLNNLPSVGTSTCHGGKFNKSGYWAPAMVYHCPDPVTSGCNGARNGEVQNSTGNEVYYKTGLLPQSPSYTVMEWPPQHFRFIGGNATSTTIQGRNFFACVNFSGSSNLNFTGRIPVSAEASFAALGFNCDTMTQNIAFPQCWDGVNLDSPDHKSHMAEINKGTPGGPTCDTIGYTAHIFPDISYNVHYNVTVADLDYWRLSSDLPETYGSTQTSADASHIKLDSSEQSTSNYYQYGMLFIGGVGHQITAYDGTTKIATVASAFGATPSAGTRYAVRNAGGLTSHGDWVNGWNRTDPLMSGGPFVEDDILAKCLHAAADCHDSALRDADPAHARNTLTTTWWLLY